MSRKKQLPHWERFLTTVADDLLEGIRIAEEDRRGKGKSRREAVGRNLQQVQPKPTRGRASLPRL